MNKFLYKILMYLWSFLGYTFLGVEQQPRIWITIPSLEKEMAAHSNTLAWKILWMEKPGRLQSMGLQRVRHDWATSGSFTFIIHSYNNCIKCIISERVNKNFTLLLANIYHHLQTEKAQHTLITFESWLPLWWNSPNPRSQV